MGSGGRACSDGLARAVGEELVRCGEGQPAVGDRESASVIQGKESQEGVRQADEVRAFVDVFVVRVFCAFCVFVFYGCAVCFVVCGL